MFIAIGFLTVCLLAKCSGGHENVDSATGRECFDAELFAKAYQLPGTLGDGYYTCLVYENATCGSSVYVKEGSVCRDNHRKRSGAEELFQCSSGSWESKRAIVTEGQDGNRVHERSIEITTGDGRRAFSGNAITCHVIVNGQLINQNCNNPSEGSSITIRASRCSRLSPVAVSHAKSLCTDSANVGSVCNFVCDHGYKMSGSPQTECLSSGRWSHSLPSCHPISCGTPGSVPGGHVQCSSTMFGSFCTIVCDPGFVHSGAFFVTCTASGVWTQADMCIDILPPTFLECCPADQHLFTGPLEAPVSVTWTYPVATDNSGQNVTLTSSLAPGTKLGPGDYGVTITAVDVAGNEASCCFSITVEARQCPHLIGPDNGYVICTRGRAEGSECTVGCNQGYDLQGQPGMACLGTEQWNSSMPTCEDMEPPEFPQGCPSDIRVYAAALGQQTLVTWTPPGVTDSSGDDVQLWSDVTPGASFPLGVSYVTYKANDTSGNENNCSFSVTVAELTCPEPSFGDSASNHTSAVYDCPDGYVHGAVCTLTCTSGHRLIGESTITCERNDRTFPPTMEWRWAGSLANKPQCIATVCPPLAAPKNGAMSCLLGSLGWDCLMSCDASWDVPQPTNGHFYCVNAAGNWRPAVVPDCIVRHLPATSRANDAQFYMTSSCDVSLDELRQAFIARISNSVLKDACVGVPSCVAANVEVRCDAAGPVAREINRRAMVSLDDGSDHSASADNVVSSRSDVITPREG